MRKFGKGLLSQLNAPLHLFKQQPNSVLVTHNWFGIMKTLSAFLLVGLLALWIELPSTTCSQGKPGFCPPDPYRCRKDDPPQCDTDSFCLGAQKCCYYRCAFRCMDPKPRFPPNKAIP